MQRTVVPELMDHPSADPALLAESLGDLAWMNRYLGVTTGVVRQVRKLLGSGEQPERISMLDVGAGGGDVLAAVGRWCRRRGVGFEGVAVDIGRTTARLAAARLAMVEGDQKSDVVCADARALPFPDGRFDVAICCTFLHHLEPDDAVRAMRELARVSALGTVITDLRRGSAGYLAARALAGTVWRRHRYTRHDAVASMRAAFTLDEARALAARAGLDGSDVDAERQLWFRWALRWRRQ